MKEKAKINICEICGELNRSNLIGIPLPENKTTKFIYNYYQCCRYYKRFKIPSKNKIKSLYKENYFRNMYRTAGVLKRKFYGYLKASTFSQYITAKDVLEIGASTGEFLDVCRDYEPKTITGIEISKDASKKAFLKYGLIFQTSNIENIFSKKKYDTIFMFHVIEHVTDPIATIKKCMSMLKRNGVLIMETPNIDSFEYSIYKKNWQSWSPKEHTFLFSTFTFRRFQQILKLSKLQFRYSPISNIMPTQVADNTIIMKFYPLFLLIYTFFYFVSYLFGKSGIVTAIYTKK